MQEMYIGYASDGSRLCVYDRPTKGRNMATEQEKAPSRLLEAAAAILQHCPNNQLNIVLLNKALFYLDLVWLRDHGVTYTGETYVAITNGPVVDDYRTKLVGALENAGIAEQQRDGGMAKPVKLIVKVATSTELEQAQLPKYVADLACQHSSTSMSGVSHKNLGWLVAKDNGNGTPIDMSLAMQQLPIEDDWLDEPADEQLQSAFREPATIKF